MTLQEAQADIWDMAQFKWVACANCGFDGYCPNDCHELEKADRIGYDRILKSYARNNGDMEKVIRYIKRTKI